MENVEPIETAHLYAPLHQQLILLLQTFAPEDWSKPTVCSGWAVRDVVAHLLDVDVRRLSLSRDRIEFPAPDPPVSTYSDLVSFLNRLNADWVKATRRVSPNVLLDFLRITGPQVADEVMSLDMMAPARFPVAWAGEKISLNWFGVARDYTERWHHQQQIRDAVVAPPLYSHYWLWPVLDTFMRALPHTYRGTQANEGDAVGVTIEGDAGGDWILMRSEGRWQLYKGPAENLTANVTLTQDTAWRHLTKGLSHDEARRRIQISGTTQLGEPFLKCLAIMA